MEERISKARTILFLIAGAVFFIPYLTNAASIGLSPETLSGDVGDMFSVSVFTSSPNQSVNAVSGVVTFPAGIVEVVAVSKENSVVNLWLQEPSFSNSLGTVTFEGIALNPGYIGNHGVVITVSFRAKSSGVADLSISSGSVLANDGAGTNILTELGVASLSVHEPVRVVQVAAPKPPAKPVAVPKTLEIVKEAAIIEPPIISLYPEKFEINEVIRISGTAVPEHEVLIFFKDGEEIVSKERVMSDSAGRWTSIDARNLGPGVYQLTAQVVRGDGSRSHETNPVAVEIDAELVASLTDSIVQYPFILVLLILSLISVIGGGAFIWYRLALVIRRLSMGGGKLERNNDMNPFTSLENYLSHDVERLRELKVKRGLSPAEEDFLKRFEDEVIKSEDGIAKKVRDSSR